MSAIFRLRSDYSMYKTLTCVFGGLGEGVYSLLSVGAGISQGVDKGPSQCSGGVRHCLCLVVVRGDYSREVLKPRLVTQVCRRGRVADLWNLEI